MSEVQLFSEGTIDSLRAAARICNRIENRTVGGDHEAQEMAQDYMREILGWVLGHALEDLYTNGARNNGGAALVGRFEDLQLRMAIPWSPTARQVLSEVNQNGGILMPSPIQQQELMTYIAKHPDCSAAKVLNTGVDDLQGYAGAWEDRHLDTEAFKEATLELRRATWIEAYRLYRLDLNRGVNLS